MPAVARPWVRFEIESVSLAHHRFQAGVGIWRGASGQHPVVDVPAGDGACCRIQQHLGGAESMRARSQWPENPVAVAAALAEALDFHMPVITGAVTAAIQFDHPLRGLSGTMGEQQQLNPIGSWCRHREIHPASGDAAAQGPGRAWMDGAQGSLS